MRRYFLLLIKYENYLECGCGAFLFQLNEVFMKTLVIIDDMINLRYLKRKNIERYQIHGMVLHQCTEEIFGYSHSTRIAQIIERYCDINLKIINIALNVDANNQINIYDLKAALNFCIDLEVDMINLSIGSKKMSDIQYIRNEIQKLHEKGTIIVSAISNDFYMTLPASLPQVIGVMHDYNCLLNPKDMIRVHENILGVQYIANANHILTAENYIASNSFSVPLVISKLLNDNSMEINNENKYAFNNKKVFSDIKQNYEVKPKVVLYGIKEPIKLISRLVTYNKIETIGLKILYDRVAILSLFEISEVRGIISNVIRDVEKYILTDLILIFKDHKNDENRLYADLYIEMSENHMLMKDRDKIIANEDYSIKHMADMIVDYFENKELWYKNRIDQ